MLASHLDQGNFEEIPIIDLQDLANADHLERKALAQSIREACVNVGFFYVKNHTIPQSTITGAVNAAKRFFSLPLPSKMSLDIYNSTNYKGYTPLLGENTNPENRGDLHEGFDLGWEDNEVGVSRSDDGEMTGGNVWPDGLPDFRRAALEYYHAAVRLGQQLFPLFALALNLPEDFFNDKTTKPAAIMRMLYYPPQTGAMDDRIEGIGAHTDYECFTILWQDDVQALQVLNNNGRWIDAVPIPGTLVVNLGDQFARWTNDVFKSTVHRAVNRSGIERYSMPLFFGTDYNVKLEVSTFLSDRNATWNPVGPFDNRLLRPREETDNHYKALPNCISEDRPAKYEVVTAGEYVKSRLDATYGHSK